MKRRTQPGWESLCHDDGPVPASWEEYRRIGEPHDEECMAYGEDEGVYEDGLQANDVYIVEGRQKRYGSKTAWQLV